MLLFLHLGCLVVNFVLGLWKYFVFNYSFSISITKIPPCVCVHFVSYFKKFAQEMVETSCIYSSNNPIWYFLLIYMNECVVHLGLKGDVLYFSSFPVSYFQHMHSTITLLFLCVLHVSE